MHLKNAGISNLPYLTKNLFFYIKISIDSYKSILNQYEVLKLLWQTVNTQYLDYFTMKRLPKRKKKHTKSLKSHFTDAFPEKEVQKILSPLDILAEKRRGGADSIKGFIFQCQYATFKILELFVKSDSSNERHVRLEGIEDIDIFKIESKEDCYEFIQVKSSKNKLDAGKFWGEHRVLQNFAEVYIKNPKNRFRLVHDMAFADGHLSKLDHACRSREVLSKSDLKYWKEKFAKLQKEQEADEKKKFGIGHCLMWRHFFSK